MFAGGGFYSYYKLQCIKLDKEKKFKKKKSVLCIQKTFNAVFKNGFSPVLGSIPRLPVTHNPSHKKILYTYLEYIIADKSRTKKDKTSFYIKCTSIILGKTYLNEYEF